jgi:serine/threonine protein kinase/tetratricopeptide (TPR) repeat protein
MAAMAVDRHLLFGLLALQTGLIDHTALMAAFHAWTRDKARPLADQLVTLGYLDPAHRPLLEALAAAHIARHDGDVEKSLAALPADKSTRESLARLADADIAASIGHVGTASTHDADVDADRTASYGIGTATSDGLRFRVLRPHARGGLGAVFVALDTELHREVALKQILDEHADEPASRARFLLEAQVTGGLEHPGIVPVYGLGTDARGRPYYAMRLIRGESLKEAIDLFHADGTPEAEPGRRSLELRKLLRRFVDVCNAIEYSHGRGVIHRDIKPRNIIVGKHGETLVVDWGLAKVTGRSDPGAGELTLRPSSSGSSETLPGSALGTPAYMSPEQAAGEIERLGPRSDVYSLGATLYFLLCGRPSQLGDDVGELLQRVQRAEFPRPRQLEPSIDPALEAVCVKAMALRPEDRYASPRLMAEDLERWMADESVSAWKEPRMRKLSRWLGRHRTIFAGSAAAILAGVVGLCAVLTVQSAANTRLSQSLRRERDAKNALTAAYADLETSKSAVQARYDLAAEAIQALHTVVTEDFLLREDRFKRLRDRLLSSASDFYGKLAALLGRETDVASRRALAQSNFELAQLTGQVGRYEAALAAHRAVLAVRESLAAEPWADTGVKADVGISLSAVAVYLRVTGKTEEALIACRRGLSMMENLGASDPAARAALAECRGQMAELLTRVGKPAEALAAIRLARADQEALAAVPGAPNDTRANLAAIVFGHGALLSMSGLWAEAETEYRRAIAIRQKLVDENPDVLQFRMGQADNHLALGNLILSTGRQKEAEAEYSAAMKAIQKLVDNYPAVTQFRIDLAKVYESFGNALLITGKEAEAEFRKAMAFYQKLVDENPGVSDLLLLLGNGHNRLGISLLHVGKPVEALAEFRAASEIWRGLADGQPTIPIYREGVADTLQNLGDATRSLGRLNEARAEYERAIVWKERLIKENPTIPWYRDFLAGTLRRRSLVVLGLGDPAGAAADARRALGLYDMQGPPSVGRSFSMACAHAALASLAGRAGSGVSAAEGEIEAARAMEWLSRTVANGYRDAKTLRVEAALDSLRDRPDFRLLMMDLTMPADPFATTH